MNQLFQCPDCHQLHNDPLVALYTLAVRCADCELDAELERASAMRISDLPLAA